MKKSKKSNMNLPTILDRIDDDLDYFYALFDVMASTSEKSDPSTSVSIEVLSRDASGRVVSLKDFIYESFERGSGLPAELREKVKKAA